MISAVIIGGIGINTPVVSMMGLADGMIIIAASQQVPRCRSAS